MTDADVEKIKRKKETPKTNHSEVNNFKK